jgi:hypothetical protein
MSATGNGAMRAQEEPILKKLSGCRARLIEAEGKGRALAEEGGQDEEAERAWKAWNQSLPPIAFEIARDTKELVMKIDIIDGDHGQGVGGDDDFS